MRIPDTKPDQELSARRVYARPAQLDVLESRLYDLWKRDGRHLEEYGSEFLGTAALVACVIGFVALMFASSSPVPALIHPAWARLFLAGLLIGSSGGLISLTPPGRLSGAHLNPAVSLGFYLLGKMHMRDFACYAVAQMAGAVAGTLGASAVLGAPAVQIHEAALWPGPGITATECFAAETAATLALCYVIFTSVSHERVAQWTPVFVAISAAVLVCLDGKVSGAGMNPARWFGPATETATWGLSWLYFGAPLLGAAGAVAMRRYLHPSRAIPKTAKLFHDPRFRSLFTNDHMRSNPPQHVLAEAERRGEE